MGRMAGGVLVFVLGLSVAAGREEPGKPATPSEQYQALAKEFQEAANAFYLKAKTEDGRIEPQARIVSHPERAQGGRSLARIIHQHPS